MLPSGMAPYGRSAPGPSRAPTPAPATGRDRRVPGNGDAFDRSLTEFAERYAEQNDQDHLALLEAIESGRLEAIAGICRSPRGASGRAHERQQ